MSGLIRTFLTDRGILNGLAFNRIWSFGTYTASPGFKKNPDAVYVTNIPKITKFSERLKHRTVRKYNIVNSFNVKTDFKRYTCVWNMHTFQQTSVLHAFKSDVELRNEFLNTL